MRAEISAESPSNTKMPPTNSSTNSSRLTTATSPSRPPSASEPVSPMMMRARRLAPPGAFAFHDDGQLNGRKPAQAPEMASMAIAAGQRS